MSMKRDSASDVRATDFLRRLKATGMTITEFQRHSGLTRNVIYNLSKGQAPSSQSQADQLELAFRKAGSQE
jgi:hypothetical protein